MDGKCFLILLLMLPAPRFMEAQPPQQAEEVGEELLFRDEATELPVEAFESIWEGNRVLLNLNTATPDQLDASGLFTPFQVYRLIEYRERYGDLYSVYELASVTGFRESRLREIAPLLTLEPGPASKQERKVHPMFLLTTLRNGPESIGYNSQGDPPVPPAYQGSPMKMSLRLRTPLGRQLSMALSYEKDPGEPFFHGMQPEFVSGYISYKGDGPLNQLIIGNFQLHHGSGLVNGSGLIPSPEGLLTRRTAISQIKPYASLNEYRFERGLGCRFNLNRASLLLWSSFQRTDLSFNSIRENQGTTDWFKGLRKSGLHRTASEINGRHLAYRAHAGFQFHGKIKELTAGTMFGLEVAGLTPKGWDSIPYGNTATLHGVWSMHGQWKHERLWLFGEMAWSIPGSPAILAGMGLHLNDFLQGLVMLHHYGKEYRGIQPATHASGSNVSNEGGIALVLHAAPGRLLEADVSLELLTYPAPRYLAEVPSNGHRYSFVLSSPGSAKLEWKFRWTKKAWQTTPVAGPPGIHPTRNSAVTRLDFRINYLVEPSFRWQTRMVFSKLTDDPGAPWGHAVVQLINIKSNPHWNCSFQFVVFKVSRWENRIYLHEPGLPYSFNFPVYYGIGEKITTVATLKTGNRTTLSSKLSVITYHDRRDMGSGNDLVYGPKKWEAGFQLRLNL